jgi:2-polyprenyl-3-methyl-5-hydroxy-6-metoxy-1,4-benzoquinol methylase
MDIVSEICARYEVGPSFAEAFLEQWDRSFNRRFANLGEALSRPDPEPMWIDFALSTNQRARALCELLEPHLPSHGRYLDVGSGYGGTLVQFHKRGLDVYGVEVNLDYVNLARANVRDLGLTDRVFHGSILDRALVESLGKFDVITCIDVIEHVGDAQQALRHMTSMLNPGGLLMMEIPNKDSLPFVIKDGHFSLFGITQLRRPQAEAFYKRFSDIPYDGMGEYHPLSLYKRTLEANGCSVMTIRSPMHDLRPTSDLPRWLEDGWRAYRAFLDQGAPKLTREQKIELHVALARYLAELALRRVLVKARLVDDTAFRERYLLDFWTVLARKQS